MDRTKPDAASPATDATPSAAAGSDTQAGSGVPPALTQLPQAIGGYRVLRLLGQGGMGAVYHARDEQLGRDLAIKTMRPDLAADAADRERFLREARTCATVEHDNVIAILHVGLDGATPYIAMPLLKGFPLDKWLKDGVGAPLGVVLKVGRETADGLAAAHERGLVHRDIKPANVWIEGDPQAADPNAKFRRVKILDFGLARPATDDAHLTHSGAVIGTPAYMSPEQGRGEKVDARTDLWSLGVMLYRLTTGTPPFRGNSTMGVLTSIAVDNPPAPPVSANVPQALSDLIMRLLSKDRNFRPASAEAVATELRAIGHAAAAAARRAASAELSHSAPIPTRAPLPAVALESNPFAGIDVPDPTEADEHEDATERDAAPPREASPKKSRGAAIAVGILLLAVVGVTAGVLLTRPKKDAGPVTSDVAKGEPKQPPILPDTAADRKAAEWVLSAGGRVSIRPIGNGTFRGTAGDASGPWVAYDGWPVTMDVITLRPTDPLPAGPFRLVSVDMDTPTRVIDAVSDLKRFAGLTDLVHLNLFSCPITNADLPHLTSLPALRWLCLQRSRVSNDGMATVGRLTELRSLYLIDQPINGTGLKHLSGLTKLEVLGAVATEIGDDDLTHLTAIGKLIHLDVRKTKLTAGGVAKLKAALPDCKIDSDFGAAVASPDRAAAEWAVAAGGLVTIMAPGHSVTFDKRSPVPADMQTVYRIDFTGKPMTDADLMKNLRGLAHLRTLILTDTNATVDGSKELAQSLPRCLIEVKGTIIKPAGALPPNPTEKQVAEWALVAGRVGIRAGGKEQPFEPGMQLPAGPFTVFEVNMSSSSSVTDADLARLTGLAGLEQLTVGGPYITDIGMKHVGTMTKLTQLYVYESPSVTDAIELAGLTKLTMLGLIKTGVTDEGLKRLGGFPVLKDLRFEGAKVTDAGLEHLKGLNNLERLDLSDTQVTGTGFAHLKGLNQLSVIRLSGSKATDAGMVHVAALPKLTALDVKGTKVTAAGREMVLKAHPKCSILFDEVAPKPADDRKAAEWVLSVGGYIHVKEGGGEKYVSKPNELPQGAIVLTQIGLSGGGPKVTDAGLANLAGAAELTSVHLNGTDATDAGLANLAGAKKLEKLYLSGAKITDAGLAHLAGLTELTQLHAGGTKVTGAGLAKLAGAKKLAHLSLEGCNTFGDADLAAVAAFPALRWLNLRLTAVSDAGLEHLAKSTELGELRLTDTRVKGPGLAHLKGLQNLRILDVSSNEFADVGIGHLSALRGLVDLNVSTTRVTGAGFERLKELPDLNRVAVAHTKVTDAAVAHLAAIPKLKNLVLSNSGVTDGGLKHLAAAKGLTNLYLDDTTVSDTGLEHLAGLTNLAGLSVQKTKVTAAGIAKFRKAVPKCYIHVDPDIKAVGVRAAVEWVFSVGGTVTIKTAAGEKVVGKATDLPAGALVVTAVSFRPSGTGVFDDVTDDALRAHLSALTDTERLDLHDAPITDVGLEAVKSLSRLKSVTVTSRKVTAAGIADLQKALPNCLFLTAGDK